jgi:hypothetical protein
VLDALHAFNADGLTALVKGSSRPKRTRLVFGPEQAERLRAVLHRSPRDFGKPTGVWTLDLAAEVSVAEGIVVTRVSGETIRTTLARLGLNLGTRQTRDHESRSGIRPKKGSVTA